MGRIEKVNKQVKHAWIAGVICGILNIILVMVHAAPTATLFDVLFIFGLTFGIYKKSRVCAVIMFIYFAINKILIFKDINFTHTNRFYKFFKELSISLK